MKPDVLYRVRPGEKNEELRYSLRSLCNVEHGDVFMVGYPPKWVKQVNRIPGKHWRTKWQALVGDLLLACEQLPGRRLLLIDDDMYVLVRQQVPVYHAGSLVEHAKQTVGAYGRSLKATAEYLMGMGIAKPLSYELHVPMVIESDAMAECLRPVVDRYIAPLQARSLYGNIANVGGVECEDVKVRRNIVPRGRDLLSSNNDLRPILPILQAALPQASRYE